MEINDKINDKLNNRNKLLFSFSQRVAGVSSMKTNEKKVNTLAHTVAQVYHRRNMVAPFAFK